MKRGFKFVILIIILSSCASNNSRGLLVGTWKQGWYDIQGDSVGPGDILVTFTDKQAIDKYLQDGKVHEKEKWDYNFEGDSTYIVFRLDSVLRKFKIVKLDSDSLILFHEEDNYWLWYSRYN